MNSSSSDLQFRVAAHFDRNVSLYNEKYASSYLRMCDDRLAQLSKYVDDRQPLSLLDIGCGGGRFTDGLLSRYPSATACCMDFSWSMLSQNKTDPRKVVVCGDAKALPFESRRFDLINVDALMHHMIEPGGYARTIESISSFLQTLRNVASPRGLLAVREIGVEGSPGGALAPRLIYEISRMRLPNPCIGMLRKLGLETAGVGVAFLTKSRWAQMFHDTGWDVADTVERPWSNSWKRPGLKVGDLFYVCRMRK